MKKILVGMSGGVDSAVSLYLLKQQGYEVAAGFMKNYSTELPGCTTREDRDMAIKVSQYLGVDTFIINDFRKQFNEKVLDYMYEEYKNGRTPNPDIFCNVDIKCSLFLSKALDMGFDGIAMGHYANTQIVGENCYLSRGADIIKDQSFFLCRVDRENLKKIIFPVGGLLKSEVREIADKLNLPNSKRKDSQGICFVGEVGIKEFLKNKIEPKKGNIIDENGKIIGTHDGAWFYTIGQSKGLGYHQKKYVSRIDVKQNILYVSDKDSESLNVKKIYLDARIWQNNKYDLPLECDLRIRHQQQPKKGKMYFEGDRLVAEFDESVFGVAQGQICCAYLNNVVLGSGIII